ncbi:hypothetical protein BofuT4_uP157530.1 [Botrytis cinerea T4]|uniref:Uncharacterized protein n=1 Tax=Botryotinia fuckeliana (strain T4) TaxID=999810 RepID=G2YUQ9_BOTF4|nr:hypothetical protein BofuT4_uP157530.1 [Botrytis cinerea T4]
MVYTEVDGLETAHCTILIIIIMPSTIVVLDRLVMPVKPSAKSPMSLSEWPVRMSAIT